VALTKKPRLTSASRAASKIKRGSTVGTAKKKALGDTHAVAVAAVGQPKPRGGYFVVTFLDSKGHVSVGRVAKRFGMSKGQLAETIGLRPETVYRAARMGAPKTQARATEMLEIIGRIADWAGGEKQAMAWYRAEPISAFGGRTAESLVKEGKASAVRDYLDHVATGGFA
jgi:hypothetical protein